MTTFTAIAPSAAGPEAVFDVLTDPVAAARWSPVGLRLADDTPRLRPGARVRLVGDIAGRLVAFDVNVHEADAGHLALTADGPVGLDVRCDVHATDAGCDIAASVAVLPRSGLRGRLAATAIGSMLAAGALDRAIGGIAGAAAAA